MEPKKEICPHCGGTETVIGKQDGEGRIFAKAAITIMFGTKVFHIVCRNCGTIIRSYVEDPSKLD